MIRSPFAVPLLKASEEVGGIRSGPSAIFVADSDATAHRPEFAETKGYGVVRSEMSVKYRFRKGGYSWKPSSSSIFSIRAFRVVYLIEIVQTAPCREIWGNSISVNSTASLRTTVLDFTGFDSSRILNLRGGILLSTGNFPEMLSQRILIGIILRWIILAGRLGVPSPPSYVRTALRRPLADRESPASRRIILNLIVQYNYCGVT